MKTTRLILGILPCLFLAWSGAAVADEKPVPVPEVLGFKYGIPRMDLKDVPGFRLETAEECAALCDTFDECCSAEIAEKYYAMATKPSDVVYLRGEVAGIPARIAARVAPIDELSERLVSLEIEFPALPGGKPAPRGGKPHAKVEASPLLDTPVGAWCVKTWGAPKTVRETENDSEALWKPKGLNIRLLRAEAMKGCRCPKGSKCKCAALRYTKLTLTIRWK